MTRPVAGARARPSGALDDTRISEREHRPRSLPVGTARWAREAQAAGKASYFPKHVRACCNNPHREQRWTIAVWPKTTPSNQTRIAYTCGSYRCPSPECQRAAAHRDFAKIRDGLSTVAGPGWCFLVLTIDRHQSSGGKIAWQDEQHAFKELSRMSRNFLARLRRRAKRNGWTDFQNRWVATVEVHAGGWPHLNLMIWCPELAAHLEGQQRRLRAAQAPESVVSRLRGFLKSDIVDTGWGPVGYAAPAKGSAETLAGYIVKVGARMERQVGEIAKLTQSPTNARMKLRRIRSGKGFIPARPKSSEWTGIMLRRTHWRKAKVLDLHGRVLETESSVTVEPLMKPEQVRCPPEELPNYLAGVAQAIREETEQANRELTEPERKLIRSNEEKEKSEGLCKYLRFSSNHQQERERTNVSERRVSLYLAEEGSRFHQGGGESKETLERRPQKTRAFSQGSGQFDFRRHSVNDSELKGRSDEPDNVVQITRTSREVARRAHGDGAREYNQGDTEPLLRHGRSEGSNAEGTRGSPAGPGLGGAPDR